jgi:hypothetical protein
LVNALVATVGAAGSFFFLWRAGQNTPTFVFFLMSAWTLAPFAALVAANSLPWQRLRRRQRMLSVVTLFIVVASLAAYGLNLKPAGTPAGFLFVMIPLVSLGIVAATFVIATLRQ